MWCLFSVLWCVAAAWSSDAVHSVKQVLHSWRPDLAEEDNAQVPVLPLKGCQLLSHQLQVVSPAPVAQLQLGCVCSATHYRHTQQCP